MLLLEKSTLAAVSRWYKEVERTLPLAMVDGPTPADVAEIALRLLLLLLLVLLLLLDKLAACACSGSVG